MHNHAIFAIPGLMPPKAAAWRRRLIAPEDGSLRLLLHCGAKEDEVHYTLDIPGWRRGVIKDPTYEFVNKDIEDFWTARPTDEMKEKWPNFMKKDTKLPKHILIPRVMIHGCAILITELCDENEEDDTEETEQPEIQPPVFPGPTIGDEPDPEPEPLKPKTVYFYLDCPARTLPVGDTKVQVTINGHLRQYIVQRPDFNIHHRRGITARYKRFKEPQQ